MVITLSCKLIVVMWFIFASYTPWFIGWKSQKRLSYSQLKADFCTLLLSIHNCGQV